MQRAEHRLGRSLADYFEEKYTRGGMTMEALATELDVNVGTISRWMAAVGVGARNTGYRPTRAVEAEAI